MLHPRCHCLPEIPKVGFLGQGQGRAGYHRIHSKVLGWMVLDFLVDGNLIYMPHANHQQKFTRQCMKCSKDVSHIRKKFWESSRELLHMVEMMG